MKIDSVTDFAVMGLRNAMNSTRETAQEIASSNGMNSGAADVAGSMVSLMQSETQAKASSEVIKTQDAMIGSLFDDKA